MERQTGGGAHFRVYAYNTVEKLLVDLGVMKADGPTDNMHDDPGITLNMFVADPNSVRYDARVKAGKATINGVSIADKAKNLELGKKSSTCAPPTPWQPSRKPSPNGRRSRRPLEVVMSVRLQGFVSAAALAVLAATVAPGAQQDVVARARAIHDRVIALDTHNDIDPQNFTAECNYTMRLTTQVNLPKMKEGGLDVSFFIVYVGQRIRAAAERSAGGIRPRLPGRGRQFDAVHRLTEQIAPKEIELALTAADVTRIAKSGKKVAVIGIENGYPIGTDLKRVKEFYDRGGRYMSLAHNGHNQLADSHTGEATSEWKWGGLSPLGRQVIQEMNRLGMMVDISHPSKAAILQVIGLSKAPVIASHSRSAKLGDSAAIWTTRC